MSQTQAMPQSAAGTMGQQPQMNMPNQRQMNPKNLAQQLSGQNQDLIMMHMVQQSQTRQNQGHQDGQKSRQPREKLPSVYVGNLPKDYYQLDLYKHVKQLGYNVFQAVICADKQTKRQNRYGFLQFFESSEAARCAKELNNTQIKGSYIRCAVQEDNFIDPKSNVFVKNLEPTVSQAQLSEAFAQFGKVRSCKIESFEDGKSRGFGYIQFESPESADAAVQKSGEVELKGKKVEILPHQRKDQRKNAEQKCTNIFVQGIPAGYNDAKLREIFGKFGEITSAVVQERETDSVLKNKGFVSFKDSDSASEAIQQMNKTQLEDGSYLIVNQHISQKDNQVSSSGNTIQKAIRQTFESNLFVKNIPTEITEDELVKLFTECGPIISVKMRQGKHFNPKAAYRQYFVLFKDVEDAKKAIQRFDHSTPFGARALSVQHWMPSSELHQERENRSFQQVQQYFFKNVLGQGMQYGMNNMHGQGNMGNNMGMMQNRGQGQRNYRGPNKPMGNKGGPRNNMRQQRVGDGQTQGQQFMQQPQQQVVNAQQQPVIMPQQQIMTPEQQALMQQQPTQPQQMQQMQQQQQNALVDLEKVFQQITDPQARKQEVGNGIFPIIQQRYGDFASKITGMLLDNERIVDHVRLVTDLAYLEQKTNEAYSLLAQSSGQNAQAPQPQMGQPAQVDASAAQQQ